MSLSLRLSLSPAHATYFTMALRIAARTRNGATAPEIACFGRSPPAGRRTSKSRGVHSLGSHLRHQPSLINLPNVTARRNAKREGGRGTLPVFASSRSPETTVRRMNFVLESKFRCRRPYGLRSLFLTRRGTRLLVLFVSFSNFASYNFRRRFFVRLSLVQTLSSSIMVNALRASRGASNKPSFI